MSLYSYSTLSSIKSSQLSNSYCLLSSSSSITTVSSQSTSKQRNSIIDDEQSLLNSQSMIENHWEIKKNVSLKDQRSLGNNCILKATMTNDHILIQNSSLTPPIIIPGKHISMKVVFKY